MKKLFTELNLGSIQLKNRVVLAPLTRSRATGNIANDMMATYYSNRASAGLLITEGTSPSPNGLGYPRIPGLFSEAQVSGWKKVTSAVHAKGGKIFVQLMHTGRVTHPLNLPAGAVALAPSAVQLSGKMWTDQQGEQPYPLAKEMDAQDVQNAISEFTRSAELAVEAGFDGVELHAANGYLLDQFLNPISNKRTDKYGGSAENRMRFVFEIAQSVTKKIGPGKVGMRVSPYGVFNDMGPFDGVDAFYGELSKKLSDLGLAYIHVVDHSGMGAPAVSPEVKKQIRQNFKGAYILSGNYDASKAEHDLLENQGELVAFGRPFIANPDLVEKMKSGAALNQPDHTKFYTPGAEGYLP